MSLHLAGARQCVLVDLHTGIGPYGAPFMINFDAPGSFGRERAREVWGDAALSGSGSTHVALANFQGLMLQAFADALPDCRISATAADSDARRRASAEYREAFIPSDPAWRASVLRHGVALCRQGRDAVVAAHRILP